MRKRRVQFQKDIPDTGYPTDSLGYFSGHFEASLGELEKYGTDKFDRLSKVINERIPDGELAGDHVRGHIEISSRIPKRPRWMRQEIEDHELDEMYYMGR